MEKEALKGLIKEVLREILFGTEERVLGFGPAPSKRRFDYIFVHAEDDGQGCWYRLSADRDKSKPVYLDPVNEAAVTGRLLDVSLVEVPTSFGPSLKFDFMLDIGDSLKVVIRSGATSFAEGLLRSMIDAPIYGLVTIAASRADKSDKAVFADLVVDGLRYLPAKGSSRLIVWETGEKARRGEILDSFLPAVNAVRRKLKLEPQKGPVVKGDEDSGSSQQSASSQSQTQSASLLTSDPLVQRIVQLIDQLGWAPESVKAFIGRNFKTEDQQPLSRISLLSQSQLVDLEKILQMAVESQGAKSDIQGDDYIPF